MTRTHADIMREIDSALAEHERVTRRMPYHLAERRWNRLNNRVRELLAEAGTLPDEEETWLDEEDLD